MARWRALPGAVRFAALLLAGALPVLAFPAPNLEFLAWFGLVPGLMAIRASGSARQAAAAAWWFGAGYLLAALYWLVPNLGPGLLLVVAVLGALWAGTGVACWALLQPPVTARRGLAALLVVPSCWLLGEWLRSWQGFGGPWAVFGASQWQHPAVLALAAVGGVWLVSFALVAANTGVLILITADGAGARLLGAAGAAVALAAGPAAFATAPAPSVTGSATVVMVQPGIVHDRLLRADATQRMSAGLRRYHPDLIVWGESSIAFDLRKDTALLGQIRKLSAAAGAQILVSQDAIGADGSKSKMAVLVGPDGISGSYVKTRLVPFGEYIPFRQQLSWLTSISRAAPQNMIPGTGAHVVTATMRDGEPLPVGVLICFESAFPDMSRVDASRGARLVIYQTSDSTFQASWALAQHASLGALRAAETGRPVVQAALTGDSAAFDAQGRLLAWAGPSGPAVIRVRLGLPPSPARTPYDRLGDFVPWTAAAIAGLATLFVLFRPDWIGRHRVSAHRPGRIPLVRNHREGSSVVVTSGSVGNTSPVQPPDSGDGSDPSPRAGT